MFFQGHHRDRSFTLYNNLLVVRNIALVTFRERAHQNIIRGTDTVNLQTNFDQSYILGIKHSLRLLCTHFHMKRFPNAVHFIQYFLQIFCFSQWNSIISVAQIIDSCSTNMYAFVSVNCSKYVFCVQIIQTW